VYTFSSDGTLAVATGKHRIYNDTGVTLTITGTRASVGTAPTGATLIVDVTKNGTTIFTTQANRPTIAISGFTAVGGTPQVTAWAAGEYLTVDVDQVGSSVAGADLTVQVEVGGGGGGGVTSVAGRTGVVVLANTDISGLGNSSTKNVGTTTGTVAAGDDGRFASSPVTSVAGRTGAVVLANTDVSGLGNASTKNVGTTTGTVAAGNDSRFSGGSGVGTGQNALTGWFHVDGYGADPTGSANCNTAFANVMTDVNAAGGGTVYCPGIYATTASIVIAHDNVQLLGSMQGPSGINYTGSGAAISSDPAAIRRAGGVSHLRVQCMTAGATALKLDNAYRWVCQGSKFESQNGTTGIGIDIVGNTSKSCYFNQFYSCDALASLASVRMNDNVNGCEFYGGVFEGAGYSLWMLGTNSAMGTNMFNGVGIQGTGANSSGVLVQIGTSGSAYACSYNMFNNCRFETNATTTIVNAPLAYYNMIIGGSMANSVTIVNNASPSYAGPMVLLHANGGLRFNQQIYTPWVVTDWINAGIVQATPVATGSRQSASSVGAGGQSYDSTLGKPIWSNGSVWKDAAGTTV
jgi:hypothetical protein